MAYYALLGAQNVVSKVIVADATEIASGRHGTAANFVETFLAGSPRGIYAGAGHTFDPLNNAFTLTALSAGMSDVITPIDTRLEVSDLSPSWVIERSNVLLSFRRPIADAFNFKYAAPNARLRFVTNATAVEIGVKYTKLGTHTAFNSVADLLIDGVLSAGYNSPTDTSSSLSPSVRKIEFTFASAVSRTIELLWPYGDSMDFRYLRVNSSATVSAPTPRPATKITALGDSITQGFGTTRPVDTWTYKLGVTKNRQIVNLGNGGRQAVATDGLAVDPASGAVIYMIGTNDYLVQKSAATFQADVQTVLQNIRATAPSARIYAVSPNWQTSSGGGIPLASYRSAMAAAVTAVGDVNTAYVDGLSIMTNSSDRLNDGIHPNATGCSEIAAALAALIS